MGATAGKDEKEVGTCVRLACTVDWICKSDVDESHRYSTLR